MLFISLFLGIALLYAGAEALVRGGASIALRLGVTPLLVGLTVISIGTSMPELVVSVGAALDGLGAVALGNVVGSNIANIALILGLSALIRPMKVQSQLVRLDVPIALGVALLLVALAFDGTLGRLDGLLLTALFVGYIGFSIHQARRDRVLQKELAEEMPTAMKPLMAVALVAGGIGLLVVGGSVFVDAALELAARLNIPPSFVALTIVAVGTSLPELATSVVASSKGASDLSIGNVVGSNIFNILFILGVTALIHPFATDGIAPADLYVMVGLTALLLPLLRSGFTLSRVEGTLLLALYVGYVGYLSQRPLLPPL